MAINRREFFKVLGVTGVTLAIGKELKAAQKKKTILNSQEFCMILHVVRVVRPVNHLCRGKWIACTN